jgi:uncharacterized SAM-binding protein YcdF (DUF218 family)
LSLLVRLPAALLLLSLVAFASGSRVATGGGSSAGWPVVALLGLLALVVVTRSGRRLAAAAAAAAAVLLAVALLATGGGGLRSSPAPGGQATVPRRAAPIAQAGARTSSTNDAIVAAALLLAAAGVAVAAWRLRRRPHAPLRDAPLGVATAVVESLDDVRNERNVRRAIVACYARMERALASVGSGRRPSETPFEYLARVLEAIAAAPARVLTELFERAMFSREPLGERDKQSAIEALEALRQAVPA